MRFILDAGKTSESEETPFCCNRVRLCFATLGEGLRVRVREPELTARVSGDGYDCFKLPLFLLSERKEQT